MRWLTWQGGSPPVLLLHGFAGGPRSWEEVARISGGRLWLGAPYLPGHDPRRPEVEPGTFTAAVRALAAACRERHPGPWLVAGYSLGGRLALGLIVGHPSLFGGALLIGANPGLTSARQRALRRRKDAAWSALLREQGLSAFRAAWEKQPLWAGQGKLSATQRRLVETQRRGLSPLGLARALEVFGLGRMPAYGPRLARVSIPVLAAAGERDLKFRALAARMAAALPRGRYLVIPRAGHNAVLERPRAVARCLALLAGFSEETP